MLLGGVKPRLHQELKLDFWIKGWDPVFYPIYPIIYVGALPAEPAFLPPGIEAKRVQIFRTILQVQRWTNVARKSGRIP